MPDRCHFTFTLIPKASMALLGLLLSQSLSADEHTMTYDRINLSASAQGKAANDILVAVLYHRSEGPSAEPLAAEVNKAIAAGIEEAKKVPEVTVQTLDYQTYPTYQNQTQKINGWIVQQSIRLESRHADPFTHLVANLQKTLKVESIGYQLSPETLRATEDKLISEAMTAFQQRAELVTHNMGRKRYRVVNLDVNTGGAGPMPYFRASAKAMSMDAPGAAPPPVIEAGEQALTVNVQGTIELQTD